MEDYVFLGLVAVGVLLLFGAGLFGVPLGIYRARPKSGQPRWNWTPILLISVPAAVIVLFVVVYSIIFAFILASAD